MREGVVGQSAHLVAKVLLSREHDKVRGFVQDLSP
jgi:hypothetical protein